MVATLIIAVATVLQPVTAEVDGGFFTASTAVLVGTASANAGEGAVHVLATGDVLGTAAIQAEQLTIEYTHREVTSFRTPPPAGQRPLAIGPTRAGSANFTNATAGVQAWPEPAQFLVLLDHSMTDVQASSLGRTTVRGLEGTTLVTVGEDPEGGVNTPSFRTHGFRYRVDGPWPAASHLDHVRVTGTFTVFMNNVTLRGESDQGAFTHWTGSREDPDQTGTVVSVESYVTLLHIMNGSIELAAPDHLQLVGPRLEMMFDGIATADSAAGRIRTGDRTVALQDTPIQMDGRGRLNVTAIPGKMRPASTATDAPGLSIVPSGAFAVRTPDVPAASPPTSGSPVFFGWMLWASAAVVVIATGVWAQRRPGGRTLDGILLRLRERRVGLWIDMGDRFRAIHEYGHATAWYRRVLDRYPDCAEGWEALAECLERVPDPGSAAAAFETLARLLDNDPVTLLKAVACAAEAGDTDRAVALALEAARGDPGAVRSSLSRHDRLAALRQDRRLAHLRDDRDPGSAYG